MSSKFSKGFLAILICFLFSIIPMSNNRALADYQDCTCSYEVDIVNGEDYFVLKKQNEEEDKCKILVLSKSSIASPKLKQLKEKLNYSVIGQYKTFAGAKFMAMGECPNCK